MKRPEYVAVVTDVYARCIHEHRVPTPEENDRLALAFSRQGFTQGYLLGKRGRTCSAPARPSPTARPRRCLPPRAGRMPTASAAACP